jgi:hypothetical protein
MLRRSVLRLPSWPLRRLLGLLGLGALAVLVSQAAASGCAGTPPCQRNSDCDIGYCADGDCRQDCIDSELDCPHGYVCNQLSQCEPAGMGGTGAGGGSGGTNPGGGGTSTTTSTATGTGTGGSGGAVGADTELDRCLTDDECAEPLVCRTMTKGGVMRCTRNCTSSGQCMSGTRCLGDGVGQSCLGDDIGRPCSNAETCNFACITAPAYCTAPCGSGADCPNGYGCMPVSEPAQNVCVKAEAHCNGIDNSACIAPSACDLSPNMLIGGCTLACNTAEDCPHRAAPLPAWTCDGLCRRPGDVYGPLPGGYQPAEYYCNSLNQVVNLCNDGQHMNFQQFAIPSPPSVDCASGMSVAGAAGDSCLDSCRYQGGCTYGYSCMAAGDLGSTRIGLCLPNGSSEPGAPCTSNTTCSFGYCLASGTCSRDCTADGVCPNGLSCVPGGAPAVEGQTFRRCE